MTHTSTKQQIAAAWNAQADEFNQWDELDLEEKIEWAAKWGASQAQRVPVQCVVPPQINQMLNRRMYATGWADCLRAHGITQEKQG